MKIEQGWRRYHVGLDAMGMGMEEIRIRMKLDGKASGSGGKGWMRMGKC